MAKPMKTPGVYIVEKNAFPNSIVEVETAVPAFIGYTQKAEYKGSSLLNKAKQISSLTEFHDFFGYAPHPMFTMMAVAKDEDKAVVNSREIEAKRVSDAVVDAAVEDGASLESVVKAARELTVTPSTGGDKRVDRAIKTGFDSVLRAVVASADISTTDIKAADMLIADADVEIAAAMASPENDELKVKAAKAVEAKQRADDAKIAAEAGAPAAIASAAKAASDEVAASTLLADKADFDKMLTPSVDQLPAVARVTTNENPYYFEHTSGAHLLYYSMRMFFENGGGKCFIVSVGSYDEAITKKSLEKGLASLIKEQVPTMIVVPEAVCLTVKEECSALQASVLKHCIKMANRIAILDVWNGWREIEDSVEDKADKKVVDYFRHAIGTDGLKYGAAYYPWLETSVVSGRDLGIEHIANKEILANVLAPDLDKKVLEDIRNTKYTASMLHNLSGEERQILKTLNDAVCARSQVYKNIIGELKDKLNLLPPSAAMAGIYTRVDNQRGVWKAPANVSVSMVNKPSVSISHDEQETLNVDVNGKSINAIREFVGEGVMVWGARTLDGNSLDWRYINVRRTLIMLEESVRLAAKAFVFEPNTANTWITMKSMISNFLTGIWKRGGLTGASPEDAFSVHVGLGETMTPEDILEGIMRITVLVAPSRPAEFVEITFQQQAQKL